MGAASAKCSKCQCFDDTELTEGFVDRCGARSVWSEEVVCNRFESCNRHEHGDGGESTSSAGDDSLLSGAASFAFTALVEQDTSIHSGTAVRRAAEAGHSASRGTGNRAICLVSHDTPWATPLTSSLRKQCPPTDHTPDAATSHSAVRAVSLPAQAKASSQVHRTSQVVHQTLPRAIEARIAPPSTSPRSSSPMATRSFQSPVVKGTSSPMPRVASVEPPLPPAAAAATRCRPSSPAPACGSRSPSPDWRESTSPPRGPGSPSPVTWRGSSRATMCSLASPSGFARHFSSPMLGSHSSASLSASTIADYAGVASVAAATEAASASGGRASLKVAQSPTADNGKSRVVGASAIAGGASAVANGASLGNLQYAVEDDVARRQTPVPRSGKKQFLSAVEVRERLEACKMKDGSSLSSKMRSPPMSPKATRASLGLPDDLGLLKDKDHGGGALSPNVLRSTLSPVAFSGNRGILGGHPPPQSSSAALLGGEPPSGRVSLGGSSASAGPGLTTDAHVAIVSRATTAKSDPGALPIVVSVVGTQIVGTSTVSSSGAPIAKQDLPSLRLPRISHERPAF